MSDIVWLVDIGNTSIKCARFYERGKFELVDIEEVVGGVVVISCVRRNFDLNKSFFETSQIRMIRACDVPMESDYAIEQIGVDRLVGAFGGRQVTGEDDILVIDAGTMITLDFVESGIHKGGIILPGIKKLKEVYDSVLGQGILSIDEFAFFSFSEFPYGTSTTSSVLFGMYSIFRFIYNVLLEHSEKKIIFTGGDGPLLLDILRKIIPESETDLKDTLCIPNLVLYGLSYLI